MPAVVSLEAAACPMLVVVPLEAAVCPDARRRAAGASGQLHLMRDLVNCRQAPRVDGRVGWDGAGLSKGE